jgi:6-phospho-beta-glucosidase
MRLTLIGGGGVRSPLFVASCLQRAERLGLDEIALLDVQKDHLEVIAPLVQEVVQRSGVSVRLIPTTDPVEALRDASYVVTTIRVGGDDGRIADERIALARGVLGQETTGPGGFSMAMRTIPEALRYAEITSRVAPKAWTFNFSNPAGLVAQALRDAGHERVIGICDGANAAQMCVAEHLGADPDRLRAEVFGLNHLSWSRSVRLDGQEVLGPLLQDPTFRDTTSLGLFDREFLASKAMWINEYLYYYYYPREAVDEITRSDATRGEEVKALNITLFERLRSIESLDTALDAYYDYQRRRISTYMPYERRGSSINPREQRARNRARQRIDEGYAGVALTSIEALTTGKPVHTALNVPNNGAIDGLLPTDVVEVSCVIEDGMVTPDRIHPVPGPELALISAVKTYERLAAQAITTRSRWTAIEALMCHPLVGSYPLARGLVDDYLAANRAHTGAWT